MVRDFAQSAGADPDRYLQEPTPGAGRKRITANEAIATRRSLDLKPAIYSV